MVVNRQGGTAQRLGAEALRERLAAAFAAAGARAELFLVPGAEMQANLERARDQALAGELDGVVVGGGDGSVNGAAALLAGTGVPLGVLPLGTLNHFSRDLGMPAELEPAAAAIVAATPRAVDVAEVNGHVFVNNSLLGAYPYMVADRERRRDRHGLGKWTAMTLAFLRMLWRFPRRRLTLCLEGESVPVRTPSLMVGVNEYDPRDFELRRRNGLDRRRAVAAGGPPQPPAELRLVRLQDHLPRPRRVPRLRPHEPEVARGPRPHQPPAGRHRRRAAAPPPAPALSRSGRVTCWCWRRPFQPPTAHPVEPIALDTSDRPAFYFGPCRSRGMVMASKQLIEFKNGGSSVIVEVEPTQGDQLSARGAAVQAQKSFEEAVAGIRPIAETIMQQVAALGPESVEVEFGVTFNATAGVILASSAVEGNCKVTLAWKPKG